MFDLDFVKMAITDLSFEQWKEMKEKCLEGHYEFFYDSETKCTVWVGPLLGNQSADYGEYVLSLKCGPTWDGIIYDNLISNETADAMVKYYNEENFDEEPISSHSELIDLCINSDVDLEELFKKAATKEYFDYVLMQEETEYDSDIEKMILDAEERAEFLQSMEDNYE